MNPEKKTAVTYAPVSSESDRQNTSWQITDLQKFAAVHDMAVLHIFQEHVSGGKKIKERAVLSRCLEYCKANTVVYLLLS